MVIRKEKKPKTEFSIVVLRASSLYEIIESSYNITYRYRRDTSTLGRREKSKTGSVYIIIL